MVCAVQAQEVTSNIVGYVKVDMLANQQYLLATPFDQVDGTANTIENVIGDQMGVGTNLFYWDGGAYQGVSKSIVGWGAGGATPLPRGSGFWLQSPADASLLLMGNVAEQDAVLTVVAGQNNLMGNPVPIDNFLVADSGLNDSPVGTQLFFWDGAAYVGASKSIVGWGTTLMGAGEGMWVALPPGATDYTWTEPPPPTAP
jgi:hypothetical protein